MPGLGNRSFQGFGLDSDLARRLEDLAHHATANQSGIADLKSTAIDASAANTIAEAAAKRTLSTVSNITNATGVAANQGGKGVTVGTHAARPAAASLGLGALYLESDRGYLYVVEAGITAPVWVLIGGSSSGTFETRWTDLAANDAGALYGETSRSTIASTTPFPVFQWNGSAWAPYGGGPFQRTQAQLATLAATLTANDVGVKVNVSDYAHVLLWGGVGFGWAPEDDLRAGEGPIFREVDPSPSTGWHLYDGSLVYYLLSTGALASLTLPDLTSIAANAAYAKAGGSNTGPTAAVATGPGSAYQSVQSGSGTNAAFVTHSHTPGEPRNLQRRAFFRQ